MTTLMRGFSRENEEEDFSNTEMSWMCRVTKHPDVYEHNHNSMRVYVIYNIMHGYYWYTTYVRCQYMVKYGWFHCLYGTNGRSITGLSQLVSHWYNYYLSVLSRQFFRTGYTGDATPNNYECQWWIVPVHRTGTQHISISVDLGLNRLNFQSLLETSSYGWIYNSLERIYNFLCTHLMLESKRG